jgi:hypothetical protein
MDSRRRWWPAVGAVAVLAAGAAGTIHAVRDDDRAASSTATPLPTARVKRADLTSATQQDGSLGYAAAYTVLGSGSGRVTWLPAVGEDIARGRTVYEDDGRAVPLFYGTRPFWRTLESGMTGGTDVLELERNLAALGYGSGLTVDRTFTEATRSAIKRWQADRKLPRSGTLAPSDVVVLPGPIRVTALGAVPGGPAAGTVLTASGTGRLVTVNLPVTSQSIAKQGAAVRIELPGGKSTAGHIAAVGTVAVAPKTNSPSQTGESTEAATLPVSITLDRAADAGRLDGAPVTVDFTSDEHRGVLAVPVEALLASADGSYSVDVVDDAGGVTPVAVELGIFDGDDLEVTGNLTEGEKVRVPAA